jgi:hypothetical protein
MVIATWLGLPGAGPGTYPGQQHGDHDGDPARTGDRRRDGEHGPRTTDRSGVAAMTPPLHAAARLDPASAGPAAAMAALAIYALAPAWASRRVSAGRNSRPVRAGGHDCGAVPW